ncbi:pyridoxal phosphate-dependent aminotransferase [Planococcus halotolerans]|uniref:Aminotransferase n=1 Tax=Planococcus halotolerans TaxID=2233542 RepID=A0A365L613_9BACL|nr:aminotransferase class I/II-fold pyridoxal phosphate-dependent enzyme [Planococcus halotolerans]RAZ80815.1 threonine-phosphate decarboxylase [Planococcus halotolerans]
MNLPNHGANPLRLYSQSGIEPPEKFLDFSDNIHPFGPPSFIKENWSGFYPLLNAYPDPHAEPFRTAAAAYHQLETDQIAAANGAAEIFTWLARRYRGKRVILLEPAFSEYRQTLEAESAVISEIQLSSENNWQVNVDAVKAELGNSAAVYICNPHNPTGILLTVEKLKEIADSCCAAGCELVIDEAFIDFIGEEASFAEYLSSYPQVIIVRSMTKMYAIAGLRLGYVLAAPKKISELTEGAAHWNVNALSATIGSGCFPLEDYRQTIRLAANKERNKMIQFFIEENCRFSNSQANFLSFSLPDGKDPDLFFQDMLKKGIVLRHTYSFKGMDGRWFRIGMKSDAVMDRLREEISLWLAQK